MMCTRFIRFMKTMMKTLRTNSPAGLHGAEHHASTKPQQTTTQESWNRQWVKYAFVLLFTLCLFAGCITTYNLLSTWLSRPATISNNLERWGQAFHIYSGHAPREYMPPLPADTNVWVPDLHVLYPDYITEFDILKDPDISPDANRKIWGDLWLQTPPDLEEAMRMMAQNYVYIGWEALERWEVEAIKRVRVTSDLPDGEFFVSDKRVFRLGHYLYRGLIVDINNPGISERAYSNIPMMIARPRPYRPSDSLLTRWRQRFRLLVFGISPPLYIPTLFKDGHVEFVPLDSAPSNIKAMLELFPEPLPE